MCLLKRFKGLGFKGDYVVAQVACFSLYSHAHGLNYSPPD